MLVLSRRLNEKIVLPGLGIPVQVPDVRRGIGAAPEVCVRREELVDRPRAEVGPKQAETCAM
jgi:sRNA-binding carbon storage regulator CsrA